MLRRAVHSRASAPHVLVALIVGATWLPAGCVYQPDEGENGTVVQALNANEHTAFDYFLSQGLTAVQAAGICGNLMQESNADPTAVQAGGPGRGIAQWSVGGRWDTDSGDNVAAYASSHGESEWSLTTQLDFIWYELTHFSGYGLAALRGATTVSAATIIFETDFEGCGECDQSTRITYANEAYAAYSADAAAWGASFVSQSFPYASVGSVTIAAGGTHTISLTMQNIGSHAWDEHTCIGTTEPRDRVDAFAGSDWPGSNRPACVPSGTTVAHGANHTFTWVMHGPSAAGRYDEHWGMVEDGVAWFSDPGEGGPADTDLEGIFVVTAAPPPPDAGTHDAGIEDTGVVVVDAGVEDTGVDAGALDAEPANDVGVTEDGAVGEDAAVADDVLIPGDVAADDAAEGGSDGGPADVAEERTDVGALSGGCGCVVAGATENGGLQGGLLLMAALAGVRRRRRL